MPLYSLKDIIYTIKKKVKFINVITNNVVVNPFGDLIRVKKVYPF